MPGEIAFVTNPSSGKGRGTRARDIAVPVLREAGFEVRNLVGRDADEALDLARACVADGVEALVVCGGDGLAHLGAQAVAETGVPLGLVPAGTGNDVARYFDLPRQDPAAAARRIVAGYTRTIDLARIIRPGAAPTYFITVLAAGFDAIVNERANRMVWPKGQMRYNLATLAELPGFAPIDYKLDVEGPEHGSQTLELGGVLVAVGNGSSFGGGLRITEGASLHDGLLDLVVIAPMSRRRMIRLYPRLFRGTHTSVPEYQHHLVRRVTIHADGIVAYADGERIAPLPLTVEVVPGALTVFS